VAMMYPKPAKGAGSLESKELCSGARLYRAGIDDRSCAGNWHMMPTSTTYDSRVGRFFNGFIAHRARSYTQSVCLSAGVRVPR
jgi:hypothetical protein